MWDTLPTEITCENDMEHPELSPKETSDHMRLVIKWRHKRVIII